MSKRGNQHINSISEARKVQQAVVGNYVKYYGEHA